MEEFLQRWQPLAAHCQANEPETFSYEAAISDKDADVVIIFERYRSKSALTGAQQMPNTYDCACAYGLVRVFCRSPPIV